MGMQLHGVNTHGVLTLVQVGMDYILFLVKL